MDKLESLAGTLETLVPHQSLPLHGRRWEWKIQEWRCRVDTRGSMGAVLKLYLSSQNMAQFMRSWSMSGQVTTTVPMSTSTPPEVQCLARLIDSIIQYHMTGEVSHAP